MNHVCGLDQIRKVITFHVSKELLNLVRGYEDEGYERDGNIHINCLRATDNPAQVFHILCVFGVGYKFSDPEETRKA